MAEQLATWSISELSLVCLYLLGKLISPDKDINFNLLVSHIHDKLFLKNSVGRYCNCKWGVSCIYFAVWERRFKYYLGGFGELLIKMLNTKLVHHPSFGLSLHNTFFSIPFVNHYQYLKLNQELRLLRPSQLIVLKWFAYNSSKSQLMTYGKLYTDISHSEILKECPYFVVGIFIVAILFSLSILDNFVFCNHF